MSQIIIFPNKSKEKLAAGPGTPSHLPDGAGHFELAGTLCGLTPGLGSALSLSSHLLCGSINGQRRQGRITAQAWKEVWNGSQSGIDSRLRDGSVTSAGLLCKRVCQFLVSYCSLPGPN